MSKVALRVYNRDIEGLIDHGQVEEAVAHCQHILKSYPKHLETYRLMGKAYLESHRYADAADIFQRVLLAAPDDFVSHLGMSIVCDAQKDINGAIWHMERAFEINSTNGGVQSELRRLIGRRDGLEPPKIYLTRGALAQIYVKGGEYQQAITEIQSVLAEDQSRNDMKTLLARAYYRAGMKNEAVEHSINLLKQYPFSLDGNRILVDILPGTSMAQGVEQYKRRIQSLDPYSAVVTGSVFDSDQVPDVAVQIERLEWDPGERPADGWSMPDQAQTPSQATSNLAAVPAEDIPVWMKQSGWGPTSGDFKDGPITFEEPAGTASGQELAAADIPEWLKAMAPPGSANASAATAENSDADNETADFDWLASLGAPGVGQTKSADELSKSLGTDGAGEKSAGADLDWLNNLGTAPAASAGDGMDWLKDVETGEEDQAAFDSDDSLPDWLGEINAAEPAIPAVPTSETKPVTDNVADWLSGMSAQVSDLPAVPVTAEPAAVLPVGQAEAEGELDWLSGLSEPASELAAAKQDVPDWLSGLSEPASELAAANQDVPDWLGGLSEPASESAAANQDVPDWLESVSTPDTLAPAAGVSETESADDGIPDWLSGLSAPAVEAIGASQEPSEWLEELVSTPEMLVPAAGVPETESADDGIPDWLSGLSAPAADTTAAGQETPEWLGTISTPETAAAEAPATLPEAEGELDWLSGLSELAAETSGPEQVTPDWLGESASAQPESKPIAEEAEGALKTEAIELPEPQLSKLVSGPGTSESEQDAALLWLESLAEKQGAKAEELITKPEDRHEAAPDWVTQGEQSAASDVEIPAAMSDTQPSAALRAKEESVAASELSALVSGPGTSESEQDAALKWLESLAEKQGAKAEELITKPEDRHEAAPDWVTQAEPAASAVEAGAVSEETLQAAETIAAALPSELSALVSGPGTSESEQDEAMKWLESLAEKQGAKAEELITKPEDRHEAAPDWVTQESQTPAAPEAASQPVEQGESLVWLQEISAEMHSIEQPEGQATDEQAAGSDEESLDWLGDLSKPSGQSETLLPWEQEEMAVGEVQPLADDSNLSASMLTDILPVAAAQPEPLSVSAEQEEMPDWLSELDKKGEKSEEFTAWEQLAPAAEAVPADSQSSGEVSDWLNGLAEEENQNTKASASVESDAAAWIASETMPAAAQLSASESEELPDWLKEPSDDEQPVVPQQVSSWIPAHVEEVSADGAPTLQGETDAFDDEYDEPELAAEPEPVRPAVQRPVLRQTGMLGGDREAVTLKSARDLLSHGGLNAAIGEYVKLIKKGRLLEDVIYDLQEAVYRHPVDVIVWQTLGDAYFRSNLLQEALDAYSKAEELLR